MEVFKLFGSVMINTKDAENSLAKTSKKTETLGSKLAGGVKKAAKFGAALGAGAAAAGAAVYKMAEKTAEAADRVDKQSQKFGVTAKQFQTLELAAEHSGVSMGVMRTATTKAMDAGYDSVYAFMQELDKIPDASQRTALAQEVLGTKTANSMAAYINGTQTLEDYEKELEQTGYISDETAAAGAEFEDTLTTLKKTTGALGMQIGAQLMPIVTRVMKYFLEHMPQIKKFVGDVVEFIKKVIDKAAPYIDVGLKAITIAFSAFSKLFKGDWKGFWNDIKKLFKTLGPALKDIAGNILNALLNGLKNAFKPITDWFNDKIEWVKDKFNSIVGTADKANNKINDNPNGYHASGLPYVPFDGYTAVLHKGERVLNANDAKKGNSNSNNTTLVTNFYGNYNFRDREDIEHFMKESARLNKRREALI